MSKAMVCIVSTYTHCQSVSIIMGGIRIGDKIQNKGMA